ncbi:MAG TPA: hypothetical protein VG944_02445, partial [Fimbriimonas sp.]|nr:hypothetical protein [Fimbriimonas sp.]
RPIQPWAVSPLVRCRVGGLFLSRYSRKMNMPEKSRWDRIVIDNIEGVKLIHPNGQEEDIRSIKRPEEEQKV